MYDLRFTIVVLVCAGLLARAWGDEAYPVARRGGLAGNLWTGVGVEGGQRRLVATVYTNVTVLTITAAQLNAVIQNCPSNQVVQLASGTFTGLGGTVIDMTKDGVVLRGATNAAGMPTTILNNAFIEHTTAWYPSGPSAGWPSITTRTITAGLSEGSTSITVSSAPNADFAPGDIFVIDQTFDGTTVTDDTQDDTFTRQTRPYCQALQILTTNATTITFQPALLGTYWDTATRTPQAVGWSSSVGHSRQFVGIEDLDIPGGADLYTLRLGPAYGCWVYNVRMDIDAAASIRFSYAVNCAVTASQFHDTTGTGSGTYALLPSVTTQCRWENNICTNASLFMPMQCSVGDSIAFNYATPPYPYDVSTWLAEQMFPHGGHTHHSIWEGNHVANVYFDDVFSNNNSDNGVVRNRLMGWASGKTSDTVCIALGESDGGTGNHRNTTILGNVLGENSYHTTYASLWHIEGVITGTIRTNNFNVVDDAVPSSEGMGSNTMLDSYVYAIKPAWFGDRPWPAFGPTTAYTNVLGYTNIPAGYRSYFGQWPPSAAGGGGGGAHNALKTAQSAVGGRRR